jgi:RHS repeat-associated protein
MVLTTPDGAKHELRPGDYLPYPSGQGNHDYQRGYYKDTPAADSINAPMRYYSFDGSYLWAKIEPFPAFGGPQNWTVYLPDGTKVVQDTGVQIITDTNGNSLYIHTLVSGSAATTHYIDGNTGREITYTYNSVTNTGQVQYQTVGGSWVSVDINYGTTWVHGMTYLIGDPCQIDQEVNTDVPVIRSIVFPLTKPNAARLQYTFSYNSDTNDSASLSRRTDCGGGSVTINNPSHGWGSLSRMVTPLGATVDYSYQWDGYHQTMFDPNLASREPITQKNVTHDGVTDTWNYSLSPAVGLATSGSVTGPDGSVTTETFYPHDPALAATVAGSDGKGGLVYRTNRSDKVIIERHWTALQFSGGVDDSPGGRVGFNTVVDAEYTTLKENGQPIKMSAKTFQYDHNGNLTQTTEYDWFDPSLVTRDSAGVPTGVPNDPSVKVLRTTTNSYYNPAATSTSANVYARRTLPTGTPLILNASQETVTGDSQTRFSYDGQAYGVAPTAGNLTTESRWDNSVNPGQWRDTTYAYDAYGNKTSAIDPSGHVTQYFYEDLTHANLTKVVVNPGTSQTTEQATTMLYDYHTGALLSRTDPNNQITETDYTNQLLGTPDPYLRPGVVTGPPVTSYVNGVTYAGQRHKTRTTYDDNLRRVTVESDLNTSGDYKLKTRTTTDELGRTILVEKNEDGTANYTISTQTAYVQMGRIILASNPLRSAAATSDGWVRTTRDEIGRVTEVATFSNAAQPPDAGASGDWTGSITTTYYANEATVKDQANKERKSVADALGRLTQVIENPNSSPAYTTNYTYDQLGNLRKAVQGAQTRFFMFDSLSRLIRTKNPEQNVNPNLPALTDPITGNNQWCIAYSYFANGNLQSKTNARNITTSYTYDRMNRNLTVDYSNTTTINPDITRQYDSALANGKGRLHLAYAGGNATAGAQVEKYEISDYDATGRPLKIHQSFKTGGAWSNNIYSTERLYDLAGNPTLQFYPSGRAVVYNYDNAGRLNSFRGNLGGISQEYVRSTTYNAAGQRTREHFRTQTNRGAGLYHHLSYTSRGHLYDVRVGTSAVNDGSNASWNRGALRIYYSSNFTYGNGGSNNNGNVYRLDHFVPLDTSVSQWVMSIDYYSYDTFNRITNVTEHKTGSQITEQYVFKQDYTYDQWGNRTVAFSDVPGAFNLPFNIDAATNRLLAPNGSISYDLDGNQTNDGYSGGGARSYDAENRMLTAQGHSYTYDADGRRVRRAISGGQTHWQIYGVAGEMVAEYVAGAAPSSPTKEYGYRGGQLLIVAEGSSAKWLIGDHLGTPRMVIDRTGDLTGANQVIRHDYLPFGEEIGAGVGIRTTANGYAGDTVRQKFTGKERDSETGLDYFEARYYAGKQGRFTSPDEFSGGPDDLFDFADLASENPTFYGNPFEPQSLNKYQYCYNNPLGYTDPDGHGIETLWDAANVALGVASFVKNVKEGNVKGAVVDAVGVVIDSAATALPFIPGGAGTAIKVYRGANAAANVIQGTDKALDTARAIDRANDVSKNIKNSDTSVAITKPYKRPSGSTTKAQRESVQGQDCAICGKKSDTMVAGHKKALVKEYYETGKIDKKRMRSRDAVRPECPTCSAREGAEMSRYSRGKKKQLLEQERQKP